MLHLDRGYDFPFHFQCDFALGNPARLVASSEDRYAQTGSLGSFDNQKEEAIELTYADASQSRTGTA